MREGIKRYFLGDIDFINVKVGDVIMEFIRMTWEGKNNQWIRDDDDPNTEMGVVSAAWANYLEKLYRNEPCTQPTVAEMLMKDKI